MSSKAYAELPFWIQFEPANACYETLQTNEIEASSHATARKAFPDPVIQQ
jgi:hypothetical protein